MVHRFQKLLALKKKESHGDFPSHIERPSKSSIVAKKAKIFNTKKTE
jgi:hypothetical protein